MAKLVCTLEMSKETGVTVTVKNADDEITQTITMDGTTLTMTVAGSEETSYWKQTQDKIEISVKDFELNASNSIKCTATETIDTQSQNGDTTIKSGADLTQSATADVSISASANASLEASSATTVKGMTTEVSADTSLTLEGSASAELKAPTLELSADASLSMKSSGIASLEGSMTNIKGSLITAGS